MRGPIDERIIRRKARASALLGAGFFALVSAASLAGIPRAQTEFGNAVNLSGPVG